VERKCVRGCDARAHTHTQGSRDRFTSSPQAPASGWKGAHRQVRPTAKGTQSTLSKGASTWPRDGGCKNKPSKIYHLRDVHARATSIKAPACRCGRVDRWNSPHPVGRAAAAGCHSASLHGAGRSAATHTSVSSGKHSSPIPSAATAPEPQPCPTDGSISACCIL